MKHHLSARQSIELAQSRSVWFVSEIESDSNLEKNLKPLGWPKSAIELLSEMKKSKVFTGAFKQVLSLPSLPGAEGLHHLVIGLGKTDDLDAEKWRTLGAEIVHAIKNHKWTEGHLNCDALPKGVKLNENLIRGLTEGLILGSYDYSEFRTKEKDKATKLEGIKIHVGLAASKDLKDAFNEAIIVAGNVNFARKLGDSPGNVMRPRILASETTNAAKGTGLKVTVWDKAKIKKEKMGGLLGVSLGSEEEPRFIIMEYKGAPAKKKPIVFVGKGLTFDSGGISIKPSAGMEEMKYDMCGGANVIATLLSIAQMKLKINAVGLVPATENMPGPNANKPGDILVSRKGLTMEVLNTDAEGRLILADALAYACELKPEAIVDAATLTGAMVISLSNIYTGMFCKNEDFLNQIKAAAKKSGEKVWHMPLDEQHHADIKSPVADMANISSGKGGGSSTAAAFLEKFVEKDIPWAHFDIAGTGWNVHNRLNYCPKKGASGAMIRTFVELAKSFE